MSRARRLEAWDKKYVWHPFTQMQEWCQEPILVIEKAKGSYLTDTKGRKYLDGISSLWCNVHGHRVPRIDNALKKQINRVSHSTFLGLSNVPAVELSRELIGIAPKGLKRVFYSDSGSEAVEIALKMAYQYWQHQGKNGKKTFLRLKNAYHGDTVGSVSVGGIQIFHDIFKPLLFKTYSVDGPHRFGENFKGSESQYADHCARRVEAALRKHHRNIAAFIMEPLVQGAAGIILQPRGFLKKVRALTRKYGVFLILDEVATGFGRTGRMFACEHEGVSPDILCLAKGLSAGYLPLSATLTTDKIYRSFLGRYDEFKSFFHGHSYTANPLACAAALENLKYFKDRRVVSKSQKTIKHLARCLEPIAKLAHVGEVRQKGFMIGIELVKDKASNKPYPLELKMGACVAREARRHGVIIRPLGNVVVLMPTFSFTHSQIAQLCRATAQAIQTVTEG